MLLPGLPVPHIAAGEVFLKLSVITSLLRRAGAFFILRGSGRDPLYRQILTNYVSAIVRAAPMLEFFMEGTRSRSGKMLHPKIGMLDMVTGTMLQGDVPNAYVVPVTINYERVNSGPAPCFRRAHPLGCSVKQHEGLWFSAYSSHYSLEHLRRYLSSAPFWVSCAAAPRRWSPSVAQCSAACACCSRTLAA